MKSIVIAFIFAIFVGVSLSANVDIFVIDSFDVTSNTLVVVVPVSGASFPLTSTSFLTTNSVFSGERDHLLSVENSPGNVAFSSSVSGGEYTSSAPSAGSAFTLVQYDGIDGSINLDAGGALGDPNGDFTSGKAFAIHVRLQSDQPTTVQVFIYSGSASDFCSTSFQVPGNSQVADYVANYVDFDSTGAGCDFTNVGAVEVSTDLPANVDITVQLFATYGSKSTPASATPTRTPTRRPAGSSTPSRSRTRTPHPSNNPCNCHCPGFHCVLQYDPSGVNTVYFDIADLNPSNGGGSSGSSDANTLSVCFALIATLIVLMI